MLRAGSSVPTCYTPQTSVASACQPIIRKFQLEKLQTNVPFLVTRTLPNILIIEPVINVGPDFLLVDKPIKLQNSPYPSIFPPKP